MASLRDIRRRIRSVESTQQITKAMKMVAASKLKKTEALLNSFRPYAGEFARLMGQLTFQLKELRHPLLAKDREPILKGRIGLVVITADRGLCGGFNTNLNHAAVQFLEDNSGSEISLICIGRKGRDFLKRHNNPIVKEYINLLVDIHYLLASGIVKDLLQFRTEKKIDSIHLLYSQYRSAISHQVTIEQFLPIKTPEIRTQAGMRPYLFEPDGEKALEAVLEQSLSIQMYRALLESVTSEYGARMTAMDNATENAGDLIESLTLSLNRARQAVITNEIIEIMGGADALQA